MRIANCKSKAFIFLVFCFLFLLGCYQAPPKQIYQPDPKAVLQHHLGQALAGEGKLLEALDRYTEATSIDSMLVEAWLDLADVSLRLLDLKKAEKACRQALMADPAHLSAAYTLGTILLKEGRFAEAMATFRKVVKRDPRFVPARLALGRSFLALGMLNEAEAEFGRVVSRDPDNVEGYLGKGDTAVKRGDEKGAITAYEHAALRDSKSARAYYALGMIYQRRGLTAEATQAFQRGAEVDSTDPAIHYRLGLLYTGEGRQEEGTGEMERSYRLREQAEVIRRSEETVMKFSDDAKVRRVLGKTYLRFGRITDGEREYRIALRLNPDDPEIHLALGCLLFNQQRLNEAIFEFQEVLRIAPDSTSSGSPINTLGHFNLGVALMRQGSIDKALPELTTTETLTSEWPPLSFTFGMLYEQAGRLSESRKAFDRFLRLSGGTPADSSAVTNPEHFLRVYEEL